MNKREYLFALLAEEAAEVAQSANKCIRFTPEHKHYANSNLDRLKVELTDLLSVLHMLEIELNTQFPKWFSIEKLERIEKYMDVSRKMGTLE